MITIPTFNATMFSHLTEAIHKYFSNEIRWKYDEEFGMMKYYKAKRNLHELEMITDMMFGYEAEIQRKGYYTNDVEKGYVGAYLIFKIFVTPDFNGMRQGGDVGDDVYVILSLFDYGFSMNQSSDLDSLIKKNDMVEI